MRALVRFRLPGGSLVELGPGDLIGRVATAALMVDDPRVSEAHAMISLRRGELYLLSLRRLVGYRGKPTSEVRLTAGDVIDLADGLALTVEAVHTPARVTALETAGLGTRPLGQVASIVAGPPLRLAARFVPGAAAHLWSIGPDQWRLGVGDAAPRTLAQGESFDIGGHRFRIVALELGEAGHDPTQGAGGIETPLRIVAHYDSVEIHRRSRPVVTIGGIGARLVSELAALGGPVDWEVVASELWKDGVSSIELRRRWDVALGRLRARLREAGIRGDLVRSDGGGQLQLVLYDGDQVDDRT
jgi:pSer/pThr/pTyr-binding forkhead associated (FHA) protein